MLKCLIERFIGVRRDATRRERSATLRHLHMIETQRFHERRRLEWRFSFSLWASLVSVAALLLGRADPELWAAMTITVTGPFVLLLHWGVERSYFAKESELNWWEGVRLSRKLRVEACLPLDPLPSECDYRPFLAHWWQVVVTGGLAAFAITAAWLTR